jgi:hypothetical protein
MKCRHDILLETSGDFVGSPVQVGKLLHWFAVDDGHALVRRSLTKCLDEDVKVTVNFIATRKDEDSPILESNTLRISSDEMEGERGTCLKTAPLLCHSPFMTGDWERGPKES